MLVLKHGRTNVFRVRRLHESHRPRAFRPTLRDTKARRGAPRGRREESESAWPETKAQDAEAPITCESALLLNWPCVFFPECFKGSALHGTTCQRIKCLTKLLKVGVTFQLPPFSVKGRERVSIRGNKHVEYRSESQLKIVYFFTQRFEYEQKISFIHFFPRFNLPALKRFRCDSRFSHLACDFGKCKALPHDLRHRKVEAVTVIHWTSLSSAIVEAPRLFIQISEQVEWLDAHVGSADAALEQTPKVFKPVSMDAAIYIAFGVVDYLVRESRPQVLIGHERVGVDRAAYFDVAMD